MTKITTQSEVKAMTRTAAAKGREILKSKEKYPEFNLMDYDTSLRNNLFFYNVEVDDNKKKKEWALAFWKDQGKSINQIKKLADGYFITAGAVAHMIHYRKLDLDVKHHSFMDRKFEELKNQAENVLDEVQPRLPQANAVDTERLRLEMEENIVRGHLAEFDAGIDEFFSNRVFDAKGYLIRNNVKIGVTKKIAGHLKSSLKEVKEAMAGKNEQLVEAYSHLGTRKLKKFADYIQSLIDSCEVATAIVKSSRKPRAKKVKAPAELVKAVKYLAEDALTKIKSEHPAKIINASEVWLYNAKTRRLFKYVPLDGMKLSIKGTTIINVDAEKSGGKIIRKPETMLAGIQSLSSRPINKMFNAIRGVKSKATGRLNEETLIVKCL